MKVLIAEDEPVSRRLLQGSLERWGYEVVVAKDGTEAAQILLSPDAPKMALLDWLMPGIDGVQLCRNIRRNKPEPYTYILMLTGRRAQDDVIRGLEAGADDYVRKPFDPNELKVRLRTGKRILYLQDRLISSREALRDQATRDPLTGLWNRAAILDILGDELARSAREGGSLGVLMADLDCFKHINDSYGHPTGDEVLQGVARALRNTVRRYDAVGRYGGEEFLIVLPGCDESNAVSHAERLRAAVNRVTVETAVAKVHPSVSLGVVVSNRHTSLDIGDLIQAADTALYRAKHAGRGRVELSLAAE
ncbi:MAG TPA: diguanylate cyclase [Pirellulales bacterium]|nr:diguanylate cyclase [Pirellulales bacterium]